MRGVSRGCPQGSTLMDESGQGWVSLRLQSEPALKSPPAVTRQSCPGLGPCGWAFITNLGSSDVGGGGPCRQGRHLGPRGFLPPGRPLQVPTGEAVWVRGPALRMEHRAYAGTVVWGQLLQLV